MLTIVPTFPLAGSDHVLIEMLIVAVIAPVLLSGVLVARTLFRWACVRYRHS